MKINFCSDLHLEFRGDKIRNLFKVTGDVLCLAGDICVCATKKDFAVFLEFLNHICPRYKYVIHVAGNHEYYTAGEKLITEWHTFNAVNRRLKQISKTIPNYIFLNGESVVLTIDSKKYCFIGATLWTKIDRIYYQSVQTYMNDYKHIYTCTQKGEIKKFTIDDMHRVHLRHKNAILKAVKEHLNMPCILVTHHKPLVTNVANNDILAQAYAVNLAQYLKNSSVKLAIHGHTHEHFDKIIEGIRYVSNPKGYVKQHTKFNESLSIEI